VPQAKRLRELVLDNFGPRSFTILPQKVFKGVSANCIIFVLGKEAKSGPVSVNLLQRKSELSRLETVEFDEGYQLDPASWKSSADKQFQIYQRDDIAALIRHARSNSIDASTHLDVMQGIVPYSVEEHSRDMITRRAFHSPRKLSDGYGPWIQGRSVGRYQLRVKADEYLRYGPWLHRPRKPEYFEGPRILVQEITGGHPPRIAACFYDKIIYHDPGIISCLANGKDETLFLLGILNSRFLSWYHQHASPKGTRAFFPKVLIGDIRSFPIPRLADSGDKDRHDLGWCR
jgi:TaqI-like C-terminal specificity domain